MVDEKDKMMLKTQKHRVPVGPKGQGRLSPLNSRNAVFLCFRGFSHEKAKMLSSSHSIHGSGTSQRIYGGFPRIYPFAATPPVWTGDQGISQFTLSLQPERRSGMAKNCNAMCGNRFGTFKRVSFCSCTNSTRIDPHADPSQGTIRPILYGPSHWLHYPERRSVNGGTTPR